MKLIKKNGDIVFDASNLTLEDIETMNHIRLDAINRQMFDDRCAKLYE